MPGPERTATEVLDRTVFDEAPCLGAIIDVEHRLLRLNRAFSELFGDGPTCHQAVKGAEEPCPECVARQAMADGQVHVSDELGRGPDGAEVSYKVRAVPLCNEGGEVDQVVLLGLDTTPLTALRVELAEVERLAEVGLSTAGLAHTIKNLLSGLDGGKYMVDSGLSKGDDDRIRMGWEMVQGYVDQVSALVRNLLRLVKEDERRPVEVAPGELVDEVVQMLGH